MHSTKPPKQPNCTADYLKLFCTDYLELFCSDYLELFNLKLIVNFQHTNALKMQKTYQCFEDAAPLKSFQRQFPKFFAFLHSSSLWQIYLDYKSVSHDLQFFTKHFFIRWLSRAVAEKKKGGCVNLLILSKTWTNKFRVFSRTSFGESFFYFDCSSFRKKAFARAGLKCIED